MLFLMMLLLGSIVMSPLMVLWRLIFMPYGWFYRPYRFGYYRRPYYRMGPPMGMYFRR
ncbi:MAG: hypothetical protein IKE59_08630 [Erysipelotrichaceae bacterium]|nr:hypothetical protein [Erysipelotrichaceae bacterium]